MSNQEPEPLWQTIASSVLLLVAGFIVYVLLLAL